MNMAKAMNPSDAVGEIVPMIDTGAELEKATSLGAGGGDRDIVPLVRVDPDYPPRARQRGIEGFVDIEFTISPVGTVQDPKVIGAQPAIVFDRAALRARPQVEVQPEDRRRSAGLTPRRAGAPPLRTGERTMIALRTLLLLVVLVGLPASAQVDAEAPPPP